MKLYNTRNPEERLNLRYIRRKRAIRLAAQGVALYIPVCSVWAALEWIAVIAATVAVFRAGVAYAYIERGYHAHGGEYLLLLIPAIYYAAKRTAIDWIVELRDLYRSL